jgi:ribonuclease HI
MTQSQFGFDSSDSPRPSPAAARDLIINVDGGARGNPGPAGYGALVRDAAGNIVAELSEFIGIATNNVAEYRGLLAGLEYAKAHQARSVKVYSDSELVVKQMHGAYKVKSPDLKPLFEQVRRLASDFHVFSIHHVPRERNADADRLANQAMDRGRSGGFGQLTSTPAVPVRPRAAAASLAPAADPVIVPRHDAEPLRKPHESGQAMEQSFVAVVKNGALQPVGPGGPVLEEGRKYEVRLRKQR